MRAFLVAALLSGCVAAPTADRACDDYAGAFCARTNDCSPLTIRQKYGDLFACQSHEAAACLARITAPGTSETASFEQGCALALPSLSCTDFTSNIPFLACIAPPGRLFDGDACIADGQCRSGTCNRAPGAGDGSCGTPALLGQSCASVSCARGGICWTNGLCVRPAAQDAACDAGTPCGNALSCVGATDGMPGACQPAIEMVGADCDPTMATSAGCDSDQLLVCDPSSGTCVAS